MHDHDSCEWHYMYVIMYNICHGIVLRLYMALYKLTCMALHRRWSYTYYKPVRSWLAAAGSQGRRSVAACRGGGVARRAVTPAVLAAQVVCMTLSRSRSPVFIETGASTCAALASTALSPALTRHGYCFCIGAGCRMNTCTWNQNSWRGGPSAALLPPNGETLGHGYRYPWVGTGLVPCCTSTCGSVHNIYMSCGGAALRWWATCLILCHKISI